jgi:hypothetical protein
MAIYFVTYLITSRQEKLLTACVYYVRKKKRRKRNRQRFRVRTICRKCRTAYVTSGRIRRRDTISLASWDGSTESLRLPLDIFGTNLSRKTHNFETSLPMSRQYAPAGRKHVLVQVSATELPDTVVSGGNRCTMSHN